jgi:hypothetical protein
LGNVRIPQRELVCPSYANYDSNKVLCTASTSPPTPPPSTPTTPGPPPIQTDTTPAGVPSPDTALSTQVDTSTTGATLDYAPSSATSSASSISGGTLSNTVLASSSLSSGGSTSHPPSSTQAHFYSPDAAGISTASSDSFPSGISNRQSTTSKHNGGAIAGGTISFVLLLIILGFVLRRYMIHRRSKRIAPSARYFAEFGTRPVSWNRVLSDHESRQYPSAIDVSSVSIYLLDN